MIRNPVRRRTAQLVARCAALGSGVMLSITVWGLSLSGVPNAYAGIDAGAVTVIHPIDGSSTSGAPLSSGGSATPFSLLPPAGGGCLGDSANDNYKVQSYIVGSAVDPNSLTWDASGPTDPVVGAGLRQPLYDAQTSGAYVDRLTLDNPGAPRPRPGEVINVPGFSFAVYAPGQIPAGTYNVGLACTHGPASATQLDRFWNVQLEVVANADDEPAGITWSVLAPATTTTSSTTTSSSTTTTTGATTTTAAGRGATTTTTAPCATTTTAGVGATTTTTGSTTTTTKGATTTTTGSTTTTTAAASTTTTPAASTTTTAAASTTTTTGASTTTTAGGTTTTTKGPTTTTTARATTTTTADPCLAGGVTTTTQSSAVLASGGSPAGTAIAASLSSLPLTGGSPFSLVVWSVLLLIFGRMAILLGRPPRVLHAA